MILKKVHSQPEMEMHRVCFSIIIIWFSLVFSQTVFALHNSSGHQNSSHETEPVPVMETVVVTAERFSEYVKNHPQNVTVLGRREIEKRNYLDLTEAIDSMPGVDVRQAGGSMQTRISIRGSSGSGSVLILVNGRPVSSGQYGSVDLGSLPIETVSRVVVFKPPVPVWLGPDTTAGAINIETEHVEEHDAGRKEKNFQLKVGGGSYGTLNASVSYGSALSEGNIELNAGGGHRDGKRSNSDKDSGYFSVHWDKTADSFTTYDVNSRYYYAEHGSAGPTYNPTPDARQRYHKGSLDFRIRGILGETRDFSVKSYLDLTGVEDTSQTGSISTLDTVKLGLKGETVWSEMDGSRALRLGGLLEGDSVDHTISGEHDRGKVSVHTQLDKDFGEMTASLGLRGDYVSDFRFFPAFSSGLTYAVGSKSLVKANGGYSVKVPTFGQLYQPSHGSIDQVRGNPDLREEDVWSYDIGVEHTFDKERVFQATLFRSDHQDLIAYQRGTDLISSPVNVAKAYRQGLELTLKYAFSKNLDWDFSYIYQKSKIRGTGTELTYTPRQNAKVTLKYTLPDWKTRCQTTLRAVSRQFSDIENNTDEELDGYTTVDIKITQPLIIASRSSEMYVDIKNLFDTDFESHYGYPDDGIRFIAGVNMKF